MSLIVTSDKKIIGTKFGSNNSGEDSVTISFNDNLSNWTLNSQAALNSNTWTSVCWSDELEIFVGVSNGGTSRVCYSSDGITWTGVAPGGTAGSGLDTNSWNSVIWARELSLFVACASTGTNRIMTSADGTTWTGQTSDDSSNWTGLSWAPELNLLVAVAVSGGSQILMTSSNATSWSSITQPDSDGLGCITWSPELGMFVALKNSTFATNKIRYSYDGVSWLSTQAADINEAAGSIWSSVIWCPEINTFIACASSTSNGIDQGQYTLMTSSNGLNWSHVIDSDFSLYKQYLSLVWSPEIGKLIAMANDTNAVTTYNNPSGTVGEINPVDSSGWTSRNSSSIASQSWNACAWSPTLKILVALSSTGTSRGTYSVNSNSINISRDGNTTVQHCMLSNISSTLTVDRMKVKQSLYSKKIVSNFLTTSDIINSGIIDFIIINGDGDGASVSNSTNYINMNDNPIFLHGTSGSSNYSFLAYGGSFGGYAAVDGPVLAGFEGGCLGDTKTNDWDLKWGRSRMTFNAFVNLNTQNGTGSGASAASSTNYFSLYDNPIFLRGTSGSIKTSFLAYGGSSGGYAGIDGPILAGNAGGCLANATTSSWNLKWDNANNVAFNASVNLNAQNGTGSGAAVTSSTNYFSLYDNPIFLRGTSGNDKNHFLAYGGTSVGYAGIDGPILAGYSGGCLANTTTNSWNLKWDDGNNVSFNASVNLNTRNGTGSGAAVTTSTNYFSLYDNPIFLRGTFGSVKNHFLAYGGTSGGYAGIDGPILAGFAGGCLANTTTSSWNLKWDNANNTTFNGAVYCKNSTSYPMVRAYKGSNTASGGTVTFQLQTDLGGGTFGTTGGTYMVTMSLQSADFGLPRGFWSGIVELSTFAGGKAQAYTVSSSNASLSSVSTAGLLTITVTQSTSSTYEFTQMQICY